MSSTWYLVAVNVICLIDLFAYFALLRRVRECERRAAAAELAAVAAATKPSAAGAYR